MTVILGDTSRVRVHSMFLAVWHVSQENEARLVGGANYASPVWLENMARRLPRRRHVKVVPRDFIKYLLMVLFVILACQERIKDPRE